MIISLRRYKIGVNTWDETNGLKVPNLLVPARGFWRHRNDSDWNAVPSQGEKTWKIHILFRGHISSYLALRVSVHFLNKRWWIAHTAVSRSTEEKKSQCSMIDKVFLFSFILSLASSLSLPLFLFPCTRLPPSLQSLVLLPSVLMLLMYTALLRVSALAAGFRY